MGQEITRTACSPRLLRRFQRRLNEQLDALAELLARPGFGQGEASFGAELELYLVNEQGRPVARNVEVARKLGDPQLTLELNRYNLEYNLSPVAAAPTPFSTMETQMLEALARIGDACTGFSARVLPIGILPTLKRRDFGPRNMTGLRRYQCLTERLQTLRGALFQIHIDGEEPVRLRSRDLTLEGANTSLQLHYRVAPERFAALFNAVQLATPVVLAISTNSPFMLGRRLWRETRVPLFKHAVDGCTRGQYQAHLPSRVDFGTGWVRTSAWELFAESVYQHPVLLPICSDEDAQAEVRRGGCPALYELQLHQGTIWPWNRAVYDASAGGHLRIEMRALPAGPSACDMLANAAFLLGLAEGLAPKMTQLMAALPYRALVYDFYRAAQQGEGARLLWPKTQGGGLEDRDATELALSLLPCAAAGLAQIGIAAAERRHYLGLIEERLQRRTSGAVWQLRQLGRLEKSLPRHQALTALVQGYMRHSAANLPVARWPDL